MNATLVQRGQRVYCALYGGRYGIVVNVRGEQRPETIQELGGGCVVMGGRASFDVVFDNGSRAPAVPESIVRGIQWRIYDEIAGPDEIAKAVQFAEHEEARKATEAEAAKVRRAQERLDHRAKNPHLFSKADQPDWSPARLAAANIRKELKEAFPGVKFRVRAEHFTSVRIHWTDGPTEKQIEAVGNKYQTGHFDGMDDCYHYDPDATFADVFGDPQYIFCGRADTLAGVREAWKRKGRNPDDVPDDWESGGRSRLPNDLGHDMLRAWAEADLR